MAGFMLGTVIQYKSCEMNYNFPFLKIVENVKLTEKRLTKRLPHPFLPISFRYSKYLAS